MSVGATISSSLHVLEEEQRQEDDGVSIFLQLCQVPRRAAQLHRYTCHGYTCEERGGRKFYTHIASAHAHNSHYKCFFHVTPGRCWAMMWIFLSRHHIHRLFAKSYLIRVSHYVMVQGRQKQQKRTSTFLEFCQASSGTLICTDVAARGLDIPEVDWIVQYDPPDDPKVSRSLYASKASPPPSRLNAGLSVGISKSSSAQVVPRDVYPKLSLFSDNNKNIFLSLAKISAPNEEFSSLPMYLLRSISTGWVAPPGRGAEVTPSSCSSPRNSHS